MKLNDPMKAFFLNVPLPTPDRRSLGIKLRADLCDMRDRLIVETIVAEARKEGVTELYLMDKQFIMDAIREKLMRDGGATDA